MERLTYKGSVSALLKSDRRTEEYNGVCLGCRKISQCTKQQKYCNLFWAIKKLAAYEDTGLTPQEIMDGKMLTGWIPVEERLPEKISTYYLVTTTRSPKIEMAWYLDGDWYWNNSDVKMGGAIAWMPLPKPYRPKSGPEEMEGIDGNN